MSLMYINWRNKAKKTVWLKVCQPPPPKKTDRLQVAAACDDGLN